MPQETRKRLTDLIALLRRSYPDGISTPEIAQELGVTRQTAFKDINRLLDDGVPVEVEKNRYFIRPDYGRAIHLTAAQAWLLYLPLRRLVRAQLHRNPLVRGLLRKVTELLRDEMADELDPTGVAVDPKADEVFETLVDCWKDSRLVEITYQPLNASRESQLIVEPWWFEPAVWTDAFYLVCGRKRKDGSRETLTLKIDRIHAARKLLGTFERPASKTLTREIEQTWGIWMGEPVRVRLRFNPRVRERLRETRWHPSETIQEEPDGAVTWEAVVSEPREVLPWIRGWGADVEVLEPKELRGALVNESQKLARLYGVELQDKIPAYFSLQAKWEDKQVPDTHPLIYHLIDVAETTLALWESAVSEQTRRLFAGYLGVDLPDAGRLLAFWASLHDLGKASPAFQRRYAARVALQQKEGFGFPPVEVALHPHGVVSTWALMDLLSQEGGMNPFDARQIAFALGGHHGAWPVSSSLLAHNLKSSDKGDASWAAARKEIFLALEMIYRPSREASLPENQVDLNAFLALFSGLVSVADWIGSMVEYFPFTEEYFAPQVYMQRARQQAMLALESLGWLGWQADGSRLAFSAMFPEIQSPNPIQETTFQAGLECNLPALLILEAPTGIGKTEAALYLADTWLQRQKGRGIYIAMPTRATSNQMHERVTAFLLSRYPAHTINFHLVHGAALLDAEQGLSQPQGIAQDNAKAQGAIQAETWFLPRKRTLLAPFGVGTVDQALMSVLQTNHFFVRMFGLGQKVVVFDEVHAYDTYMSTLFQRLLGWLRSTGTSVILLSATLPEKTRAELAAAWAGKAQAAVPPAAYPRLTLLSPNQSNAVSLPPPPTRTVYLDRQPADPSAIAAYLDEKLSSGGCAAVVCNRVARAQEVYKAIQDRGIVAPENLILFHARFPFAWRKAIEDRVLAQFGKKGRRPHKAIVVATQVIEQSLDLDFDLMISDLAPVDLLLQRAGRLHRHAQNDSNRPAPVRRPCLALTQPEVIDGLPSFGNDTWVYEEPILLRTWQVLHGHEQIHLPDETSALIEAVYGDGLPMDQLSPVFLVALRKAEEKARLDRDKEILQARQRLVAAPEDEQLLTSGIDGLEEDNPAVHQAFRAMTRLIEPGVSLICLHQTGAGLALEPDGSGAPLDLHTRPNLTMARDLLKRVVSVQNRAVVDYFIQRGSASPEWKTSSALRYHYPAIFDANGECLLEGAGLILKLTRELGLVVLKEAK